MRKADKNAMRFVASVVLVLIAGVAAAQQPAPRRPAPRHNAQSPPTEQSAQSTQPSPPQGESPQRTTATYDDWVVQCETRAGPPPEKVCDMAQVTQVQGKNLPFSRVALAHPVKGQPIKLVVQFPVNASFGADVRIQTSDGNSGVAAPFARCLPTGCFADFEIKEDTLKKFRTTSSPGKLSFADATGHDVAVPLSFNGFGQAFDALAKE